MLQSELFGLNGSLMEIKEKIEWQNLDGDQGQKIHQV